MNRADQELQKGLENAASSLMSRVYAAIPPDDAELMDLCEQWTGALQMALKYAKEPSAVAVADALLAQLLSELKKRGVNSF